MQNIFTASTNSHSSSVPHIIHYSSSSIWKTARILPARLGSAPPQLARPRQAKPRQAGRPQSHRCPTAQAQALLTLSIPNYLPSRQGKSLKLCLLFQLYFVIPHPFGGVYPEPSRMGSGQALIPNPFLILTSQFSCCPVTLLSCYPFLHLPSSNFSSL